MQDLRYALRGLWHARGFAAVAIVCLGLGIGFNTAIFSIVDGVLLKPFPYAEPDRLVFLRVVNEPLAVRRGELSWLDFADFRDTTTSLTAMAAVSERSFTVSDGREPARYLGAAVSWNLFPMLGVAPLLGGGFVEAHDRPGAEAVVILGHDVWVRHYNADSGIVGRAILVNSVPTVVVGVMPPRFAFPFNQRLWVPLAPFVASQPRDQREMTAFARLAAGATLERANAELASISGALAERHPATNADWRATVVTLREEFTPEDVTLVIWIMMAAVTLVLFIACSNVANLLMARAASRRREIAVRAALGAGRGRIVRQLVTESIVLGVLSVPFGVVVALAGTRLIAAAMPVDDVPYYVTWSVDARVLAYTLAVAVGTAVLFGLLPAVQATRESLSESLKEGMRGTSVRRSLLRSGLVVAQVSLALVALVGALLFVRTFVNLDSYEVGFDTRPLMTMRFYMGGSAYAEDDAKARRVQDIVERVERLPAVEAAFASNLVPVSGGGGGGRAVIDGFLVEAGREPAIGFTGVTPHLLQTLGLQATRGRVFTDAEGWSRSAVAIINETMATRFWSGRDPIGSRFRLTEATAPADWFTVIGVAADIKHDDIDPDDVPFPAAYVPYLYQQTPNTGLTIRVSGDPAAITAAARGEIRAADSELSVFSIRTMEEVRRLGFWQFSLFGWIFGTVGLVGLVLAATGVYGVLAYSVSQRTQEIGVRMALGAHSGDVLRLVVGQGLVLAAVGIVVGVVLAAAAMPAAASLFYNVSPFDPLTFGAVAAFLGVVAFVASYVPAVRATTVDPVTALRGGE
ncbi:MAG: ABC transporter permease [Acidobacteriota bacterium]